MSEANSKKVARDSAEGQRSDSEGARKRRSSKASNDLGRALKSVYDSTLGEDVPSDFLDLLGKLD